jgi:hypothetical protein
MIETETFALNPRQYFRIIATNRLRKSWWLFAGILVLALLYLPRFFEDDLSKFFVLFSVFYPIYSFGHLWYFAHTKENKAIYKPRSFVIDDIKLASDSEDGLKSEIPFSSIVRVVERKAFWMLYIAKGQFIYLPKSAFRSEEDEAAFNVLLIEHVKP